MPRTLSFPYFPYHIKTLQSDAKAVQAGSHGPLAFPICFINLLEEAEVVQATFDLVISKLHEKFAE